MNYCFLIKNTELKFGNNDMSLAFIVYSLVRDMCLFMSSCDNINRNGNRGLRGNSVSASLNF
jgi:hypothetical protein